MSNVTAFRAIEKAPKAERSEMETLILTIPQVDEWLLPPFQREFKANDRVMQLANELRTTEYLPGVITLGRLGDKPAIYKVDGQHRIGAFKISGLDEVMADVRLKRFETMADMAAEYVLLNSNLNRMKPDDVLKGHAANLPNLRKITKECPFVGYSNIRRGESSPILSMSQVLRCWHGSSKETPTTVGLGTATGLAEALDEGSTNELIFFLTVALDSWGRDKEYVRLWGGLNLMMTMWLWRKLVLDKKRTGNQRHAILTAGQFAQCMTAMSADSRYLDWLYGRIVGDRDRSPCYGKLKDIIVKRVFDETGHKIRLLQPGWASK
jgi:hypothetical protein